MRDARVAVVVFTCVAFAGGAALLLWGGISAARGVRAALPVLVFGVGLIGMAIFLLVALSKDPSRHPRAAPRPGRVATAHTVRFTVGDREKHDVVYTFDQMWGWLTVWVDGRLIVKRFVTVSFRLSSVIEFEVGEQERHLVRIEKTRPLMFAFAQPQPIRAFSDGALVAHNDGVS
ncbi:hypothetical protein [Leifsonia sp. EB34]|uniref:hypothetical protein n=1 Tax=Leifsonia sp. EB34 TaxID=3156303 RepID=UPI0035182D6E